MKLSLAQRLVLAPLQAYRRLLSPLKSSPSCRFQPTCSRYAVDAVVQHGAGRGSYLALRRLLKCHPFHPGGFDPVPTRPSRGADLAVERDDSGQHRTNRARSSERRSPRTEEF